MSVLPRDDPHPRIGHAGANEHAAARDARAALTAALAERPWPNPEHASESRAARLQSSSGDGSAPDPRARSCARPPSGGAI